MTKKEKFKEKEIKIALIQLRFGKLNDGVFMIYRKNPEKEKIIYFDIEMKNYKGLKNYDPTDVSFNHDEILILDEDISIFKKDFLVNRIMFSVSIDMDYYNKK